MLLLLLSMSWADCPSISSDELVSQVSGSGQPAVLVLGERHGERRDLRRARRVVRSLARRGTVTLALEAAHHQGQPALDAYGSGEGGARRLREGLDWSNTWGYNWGPYGRLFRLGRRGVALVGAGLTLGPAPEEREVPIPDGYADRLAEVMQAHGMPLDEAMKARFTRSMAWRDLRIGELAVEGWSGEGVLVILTGRGHVQGGQGTSWQLQQMGAERVFSALLAETEEPCGPDDRVVR